MCFRIWSRERPELTPTSFCQDPTLRHPRKHVRHSLIKENQKMHCRRHLNRFAVSFPLVFLYQTDFSPLKSTYILPHEWSVHLVHDYKFRSCIILTTWWTLGLDVSTLGWYRQVCIMYLFLYFCFLKWVLWLLNWTLWKLWVYWLLQLYSIGTPFFPLSLGQSLH